VPFKLDFRLNFDHFGSYLLYGLKQLLIGLTHLSY